MNVKCALSTVECQSTTLTTLKHFIECVCAFAKILNIFGSVMKRRIANPLNPLRGSKRHLIGVKFYQNGVLLKATPSKRQAFQLKLDLTLLFLSLQYIAIFFRSYTDCPEIVIVQNGLEE